MLWVPAPEGPSSRPQSLTVPQPEAPNVPQVWGTRHGQRPQRLASGLPRTPRKCRCTGIALSTSHVHRGAATLTPQLSPRQTWAAGGQRLRLLLLPLRSALTHPPAALTALLLPGWHLREGRRVTHTATGCPHHGQEGASGQVKGWCKGPEEDTWQM